MKAPLEYLTPWRAVESNSLRLQTELAAEVGRDHPLYGRGMRAVAVRQDRDDVLFVSVDEPQVVAVVHLTWSDRARDDGRSRRLLRLRTGAYAIVPQPNLLPVNVAALIKRGKLRRPRPAPI